MSNLCYSKGLWLHPPFTKCICFLFLFTQQATKTISEPIEGDKLTKERKKISTGSVDPATLLAVANKQEDISEENWKRTQTEKCPKIDITRTETIDQSTVINFDVPTREDGEKQQVELPNGHGRESETVPGATTNGYAKQACGDTATSTVAGEVAPKRASIAAVCDNQIQVPQPQPLSNAQLGSDEESARLEGNSREPSPGLQSTGSCKSFKKHRSIKRLLKRVELVSHHGHHSSNPGKVSSTETSITIDGGGGSLASENTNGHLSSNDARLVRAMLINAGLSHEEENHGEWCPEIPFQNVRPVTGLQCKIPYLTVDLFELSK